MAERSNAAVLPRRIPTKKLFTIAVIFYTYILKSTKDGKYYYGYCSDLEKRLKRHNDGHVRSTKSRRPVVIHYFEKYVSKSEALKRELFFKSIDGYNWLKEKKII